MATCTLVHVSVKDGKEDMFWEKSVINATASVQEEDNLRFDVLQSRDDPAKFVLVETYGSAEGPPAHKQTEHYNAWREAVADWMADPRHGVKYNVVFPETDIIKGALETSDLCDPDVTLVYVKVKEGMEDAFLQETILNADAVWEKELEMLRFDILQEVGFPGHFVLVEVYQTNKAALAHKETKHYLDWREKVKDMMEEPREGKKFLAAYPVSSAGWRRD